MATEEKKKKRKGPKKPNENQAAEINKWNDKLQDPNLSEKARARISQRIKFLGGQVLNAEQYKGKQMEDMLGPNTGAAKDLADQFYAPGSLGRVDSGMEEYVDENGITRTRRVGETQEALDRSKGIMDQYGQRSPEMQDAIDRNKSLLQGYDAPEMQAIREQASKGLNTQYQTQMRQLTQNQARAGVRGASAVAQGRNLDRQRMETQGDLEQNLFVKNADEKRRALGDYTNLIGNTTQAEYSRSSGAQESYANQLARQRQDELGRAQTNLGQTAAENAGRLGTYLGGIGAGEARAGRLEAERNARRQTEIARQQAQMYADRNA